MQPDSHPVTLQVYCRHCHGAVTLQFADWKPEDVRPPDQVWACPYCDKLNIGGFPGKLAWARTGHDDAPTA